MVLPRDTLPRDIRPGVPFSSEEDRKGIAIGHQAASAIAAIAVHVVSAHDSIRHF